MSFKKVFVIKDNITDDAESICDDIAFKVIKEMPVDLYLVYRREGSMGRNSALGGFISGIRIISSPVVFQTY